MPPKSIPSCMLARLDNHGSCNIHMQHSNLTASRIRGIFKWKESYHLMATLPSLLLWDLSIQFQFLAMLSQMMHSMTY
uniref:Uncharacterized protein n=1 Tax=Rhizophora mucronata TaxID=61149 RepID=A0A2P2Q7C7_RHIMU